LFYFSIQVSKALRWTLQDTLSNSGNSWHHIMGFIMICWFGTIRTVSFYHSVCKIDMKKGFCNYLVKQLYPVWTLPPFQPLPSPLLSSWLSVSYILSPLRPKSPFYCRKRRYFGGFAHGTLYLLELNNFQKKSN